MERRRARYRRPAWWPEGEPWPPTGPPNGQAWRVMRGRFFRRFGCLFLLLFGLAFAGFLAVLSTIGNLITGGEAGPFPFSLSRPWSALSIFLIVLGLFLVLRSLLFLAAPVGDLMQAVGHVADGDYSARARIRGPRDVQALARAFNAMAERLQNSDEQRRNLLADVTHELRTPLTVIQGNLEGLIDGVYPRDDAHLVPILEETRVLSRLIDDLRTLALAESGQLKLAKESTDLGVLISETVIFFQPRAEAAQIALKTDAAPDVIAEVDPARIREVLENVIANAIRYTPAGGTVQVRSCAEDDSVKKAVITVADSGSGISREDMPHIFDRFYRSPDSRGTGLGLAIAKNLVAAHGGEISAESEVGKGTTIRISLPG